MNALTTLFDAQELWLRLRGSQCMLHVQDEWLAERDDAEEETV